jgi:lysophospholipase L1-like esterase
LFNKNYSFESNTETDAIPVSAKDLYNSSTGYGFLPLTSHSDNTADKFIECGGWLPGKQPNITGRATALSDSVFGVELRQKDWPLRFRASVPEEGVYAVTIKINGGNEGLAKLNIYSGRRNMVRRDVNIAPGEVFTYRYFVHICDYIPIMGQPPRSDLSIYIAILGETTRLSAVTIEKSEAPTLFIGGDSIVADYAANYPYNPIINGGAWGQYLMQYLNGIAVDNQAHGGMTTNCFRDDGHWDIISKRIRPGDIFMFQFGHNDQKRRNLAAFSGYSANLRWYVHQVRSMGAIPVIVTSLSRIPSKDEYGYYDLLEDHAEACRRVGREWKVPIIDLHQHSFEVWCQMGNETLKGYFNDAAHTNDYGAVLMAEFIAKEIKRQQIESLCHHMNDYFPAPWIPDESLRPAAELSPTEKPERPILPTDLPDLPYIDCLHIRQLSGLKEAMAKGLLDPCLKFYHPFEEMPRGQFLFLFFKAAKSPQKRLYQGRFCDIYRYEWDASNVQAALDAELIDETTTPNDRFRPDDGLTGGEFLSFIIRNLHELGDRDYNLAECEQQAKSLGIIWEGYERNKKVNRADCTVALVHMMNITEAQIKGLPHKRNFL